MHFNREEFDRHTASFSGKFEERRKGCLLAFWRNLAVGLVLLVADFVYTDEVNEVISYLGAVIISNISILLNALLSIFFASDVVSDAEMAAYMSSWRVAAPVVSYLFIPLFLISFILYPVFSYRHHTHHVSKFIRLKISLKEFVFSNIFSFFGELEFKRKEGVSLHALANAPLLPKYNEINMEDRIAGQFCGVKLEMSEVELLSKENGRDILLFKGMFVIMDISETATGNLRAPFGGKTILVQDEVKHLEQFKNRYEEYKAVPLPTNEYEERFEAVSTAAEEAKALLNKPLLDSLSRLAEVLTSVQQQVTHFDDSFIRKLYLLAGKISSAAATVMVGIPHTLLMLLLGRGYISPWVGEMTSPVKYSSIVKDTDSPSDDFMLALSHDIHCSFFDDKIFITIPYDHDLFEPNSLFEPALVEEDKELVFNLMETLAQVAHNVTSEKITSEENSP